MSVSCSAGCFSDDLLCCDEDSSTVFSSSSSSSLDLPEFSPEAIENISSGIDEWIAGLIGDEESYAERFRSHSLDASAREDSVAWILKVQRFYGFQPLTAYLSVNYLDRFLHSRRLPETNDGWALQLLSVACLSLAAKMEEPLVPSLLDLQVSGAKFVFETRTILRMELLVLSVLDWKLRSITPLDFLSFFAFKIDSTRTITSFLASRATQILLSNILEADFLEFKPSCIAASAILCAASEFPNFSLIEDAERAENWCDGLHREKILRCYGLMQQIGINNNPRKAPKVIPQLRVMTRTRSSFIASSDSLSSPSSSPSSLPTSSFGYHKRRKLDNSLWTNDDDKETSD